MGWFDRLKAAVGGPARDAGAIRIEGDRVVFTTEAEARRHVPRLPEASGPEAMGPCEKCGAAVRQVVVTTAGGGAQVAVWRAYPLAVDGWVCTSCGWLALPRRLSPEEITKVVQTGVAHAHESLLDDAEYWFLRAVSSWPGYPPALFNLAQVYVQRCRARDTDRDGLRRQAAALLRRATRTAEHCPTEAIVELSKLEAVLGDEGGALARLDALATKSDVEERVQKHASAIAIEIRKGRALCTRASELAEGKLMLAGVRLAKLDDESRRRLQEAVALLETATERDAGSFPAWWMLGKIHQRLGDHKRSHEDFARALEADPNHVDGCREYVASCLEIGRAEEALHVAARSCSLKPGDAGLRANLALVQLFAGKVDEAKDTVEQALDADPQDKTTAALASLIADVRAGRRQLPRTLAELEGRA